MLRKDVDIKEPQVVTGSTLIVEAEGKKLEFIRFTYLFAHPFLRVDELVLLDMRDIAPMKIDTITGRGHKKDFMTSSFCYKDLVLTK